MSEARPLRMDRGPYPETEMKTLMLLLAGALFSAGSAFVQLQPEAAVQAVTSAAQSLATECPCPDWLCPEWLCRLLCPDCCPPAGGACCTTPVGCCGN